MKNTVMKTKCKNCMYYICLPSIKLLQHGSSFPPVQQCRCSLPSPPHLPMLLAPKFCVSWPSQLDSRHFGLQITQARGWLIEHHRTYFIGMKILVWLQTFKVLHCLPVKTHWLQKVVENILVVYSRGGHHFMSSVHPNEGIIDGCFKIVLSFTFSNESALCIQRCLCDAIAGMKKMVTKLGSACAVGER